jgi:hypothetical protein
MYACPIFARILGLPHHTDGEGNDVVGEAVATKSRAGARRETSSAGATPIELTCLPIPSRLGEFLAATSIALHPGPFLRMNHDAVYATSA